MVRPLHLLKRLKITNKIKNLLSISQLKNKTNIIKLKEIKLYKRINSKSNKLKTELIMLIFQILCWRVLEVMIMLAWHHAGIVKMVSMRIQETPKWERSDSLLTLKALDSSSGEDGIKTRSFKMLISSA